HAELAEGRGGVLLDRVGGEPERRRDRGVGRPGRERRKYIALTRRNHRGAAAPRTPRFGVRRARAGGDTRPARLARPAAGAGDRGGEAFARPPPAPEADRTP